MNSKKDDSVQEFDASYVVCFLFGSARCKSLLHGVHSLDERYVSAEVIKCKDGSKYFNRNRLNDSFCDCIDGTDEPGTSAYPASKFYCRNVRSTPQFIFSSRIDDHFCGLQTVQNISLLVLADDHRICDCCEGTDEYGGSVHCPNTHAMGGNIEYKTENYISTITDLGSVDAKETKDVVSMNLIQMLKVLQVVLISFVLVVWIIHHHVRFNRRHYR